MEITVHPGINIVYHHQGPRVIRHEMAGKSSAISDGCGNLTANHPSIRAGIERDAKAFREITDLKGRGII